MAARDEILQAAWTGGTDGRLSAASQAKAWALREAWRADDRGSHGPAGRDKREAGGAAKRRSDSL